ncbi:RNA-binding domain-containing protein [Periconia macrospinosa]|uniref:RNA-binding domain-containing protein n=1 Tax=Periconia macrospinosa TaxID=97972 RepID=A0A2V1DS89_9PLEO|nr:RNA-binding domain-containing protein [Periconia macrospinosa]
MSNKDLHPHPSLPARPPTTTYSAPPSRNNTGGARTFGSFTPRAVVAQSPAQVAAPPALYSQPPVSAPNQLTAYPSSNAYYSSYQAYGNNTVTAATYSAPTYSAPTYSAPNYSATTYSTPTTVNSGYPTNYDPEEEARIAEWNSAYTRGDADGKKAGNVHTAVRTDVHPTTDSPAGAAGSEKQKTVVREAGGKSWEDPSLLEWNPQHPRLFIGNLAGEVTDDSLLKAFSKYPSVVKARVVRDKRSTKSKSYGFVSFSDTDDYFRAAKEMQGKYIGSHPVLIKRATSEVKPTVKREDRHGKYGKNHRNNNNKNKNNGKGPNAEGALQFPGAAPFSATNGVHKKGKNTGQRMLG